MLNEPGRPRDARRDAYQERYGLTATQVRKMHAWDLDQLDACLSEEARRILLGRGEQ